MTDTETMVERVGRWLARTFHRHEWRDVFVFDSAFEMVIPTGERRVIGRAVMMECAQCGAMQRRPLAALSDPKA